MQNKVRTTLNLDKDIMKNIKQVALNKDKTLTEIINEYLKKGLMSEKETYKQYRSLNEIAGIFKAGEAFDSLEEVKKLRKKESNNE